MKRNRTITTDVGHNIVVLHRDMGDMETAEPNALELLQLFGSDYKGTSDSCEVLRSKLEFGNILRMRGRLQKADVIIQDCLVAGISEPEKTHELYNNAIGSLAILRHMQGKFPEAENLFLEALHINRNSSENTIIGLSTVQSNLGNVVSEQGKYIQAKLHLR